MNRGNKGFSLLFVIALLAISSLIMAKPVFSQSIPTPSVPQFTLTFQDNSYAVQPTTLTTTDPYTGKQTIVGSTIGGYVYNASITIRVTNQPFTSYTDANNNTIQLYYDVRWKGNFTDSWEGSLLPNIQVAQDSSSAYTDIPLGFTSNTYGWGGVAAINWHALGNPVDIQVEACVGYVTQTVTSSLEAPKINFTSLTTSGWSNTQTIIASNVSTSPTPTATPTSVTTSSPAVPELSWLVIVPLLLSLFSVAVIVRHRKMSCRKA
ncbi:MAG: hypothetical protein ABSG33_10775 [Candidatus Bathyarchaeia archaeon]|jgi:hypothetical protein